MTCFFLRTDSTKGIGTEITYTNLPIQDSPCLC
jgi:hypothetical protein